MACPPPPPSDQDPAEPPASAPVQPGTMTALLREIAAAPEAEVGAEWEAFLRPGASVGRFELVRELGRGGFGVVWEARDPQLGRSVALKAVRAGARRDVREERLLREAESAARLSHPNIVTLFDVGRAEAGPYLVLELLKGETLEERLAKGPIPVPEAVRIFAEIAMGVAHAHGEGVVHRDLKPANVFLCRDGRVKVLDFGLAHAFGQRLAGGGTSGYMAPEQVEGAPEDERTDVWALGVMLFEMMSGRRPFADEKAVRKAAPALEVPGAPALGELTARMLSPRPVERPRDGGQVLEALAPLQLPRGTATATASVRTRRRSPWRLAAIGAVLVAVAAVGLVLAWRGRAPSSSEPAEPIVVAVADFANETKDPDLDGLSGLLITALAESPRLRVLTRSRMFDLARQAGRESVERIDEPLAREVGRRAAAKALLLASVRRFDDVYAVELRALAPVGDAYLFTAREQTHGKRNVPGLVDALAVRTRVALGEDGAEVRREGFRVAEAVTGDLEAHRHYFLGLQRIDEYRFEEGATELGEAIRIDPGFAQAHLQLLGGRLGAWVALRDREAHLAAALAHADRLPETDRLRLNAEEALLHGRPEEAFQGFERVLERSPSDKRVLLRMYLLSMSPRGDLVAATSFAERALALDPSWQPAQDAVAIALVFRGEFARAEALAREWAERWPSPITFSLLNGVLLHAGRPQEALAVARRTESTGTPGGLGVPTLARTLVQLDRFEEAEALLRRYAAAKPAPPLVARMLPGVALYQGRRREMERILARQEEPGELPVSWRVFLQAGDADVASALDLARRALPEVPGGSSAAAFAVAGHADAAAELLGKHDPGLPASYTLPPGTVSKVIEALRARDRGDVAGARRVLEEVRRGPSRPASHAASYVLGQICFAAGEDACAVEALDEFQRHHWLFDVSAWAYPRSLYLRAAAEERMGRAQEARATIERLLAIWKRADPDLPLLAEARALRKRLAAQPPSEKALRALTPPATKAEAATPSIAVLPFADMSPGKDQEYLSDGIAEEILSALASVEGLRVPGRSSSFYFKGKNAAPAEIARKLRVAHLLDGSVRRSGDTIRVRAEVVEVSTGERLWSQTFERKLDDVFAVQDAIARAVVEALKVRLLAGAVYSGPRRTTTTSPEAYEHYLRGQRLYRQFTAESLRQAVAAFEKAVVLDPGYAPAWAAMGIPMLYVGADAASQEEALAWGERALAAAEKALALSPDLCDGLSAHGFLRGSVRWDWTGGLADLARAVKLCPGSPDGWRRYAGMLFSLRRLEEALPPAERAAQLDPIGYSNLLLAKTLRAAGHNERSLAAAERAAEAMPGSSVACGNVASALLALGRPADSLERFRRCPGDSAYTRLGIVRALWSLGRADEARSLLAKEEQQPSPEWVLIGIAHAWMGDGDKAFESVTRAVDAHDLMLGEGFLSWPELRPLHSDPRWKALLRKLNLPVD